jgi:hypothetical protein
MTTFDDRENAFENMFAHDAEMEFKALARRDKLLGLWAAEKMGLTGDAALAYARAVVAEDLKQVGDEDVFDKVKDDLESKGVDVKGKKLRKRMAELMIEARAQIVGETDR